MEPEAQRYYTISDVARKLKVKDSTLRYYEREFGNYLVIRRTAGGRRLYSDTNIEQLKLLFRILHQERLSIAEAKERLNSMITKSIIEVTPKPHTPPVAVTVIDTDRGEDLKETFDFATREDLARMEKQVGESLVLMQQILDQLGRIGSGQRDLKHLLDLNIQRYNLLASKIGNK